MSHLLLHYSLILIRDYYIKEQI